MSKKRKIIRGKPIKRFSDPMKLPGSIAGPGDSHSVGEFVLDTSNAVLMDSVVVSTLDSESNNSSIIALVLGGRVNQTQNRAEVMFLFGTDGVAAIMTELGALLGRVTGVDPTAIISDIVERMSKLREEGNLT